MRVAEYIEVMLNTWLHRMVSAAPSRCAVCGHWPSQPICAGCLAQFARSRPRCDRCALPVPEGVRICGACVREAPPLERCHAAVDYAYPWSGLITEFKFQAQPGWAESLSALMRTSAGALQAIEAADRVLPMPLSKERLALRGFNQAYELARRLAPAKADAGTLLRLRNTQPQTTLGRRERQANVRGAFGVAPAQRETLRGQRVLLVDDVMTSGASLFAAAQALHEAGVASVSALVLARTDEMTE